jgi:hypothetical protein
MTKRKVGNRPNFLTCKWCATYPWKAFDEGYNFVLNLISIGGLHTNVCTPKVAKVLILGISILPLGSSRTKCHLDASLMASHRIYYKGEGRAFPQVRAVVNLVSPNLPMVHLNTKSAIKTCVLFFNVIVMYWKLKHVSIQATKYIKFDKILWM